MAISTINSSGLNQAGDTVFCTTSGNVGIGTSSPTAKLDVFGGSGAALSYVRAASGQNSFLSVAGNGNTPISTSFDIIQDALNQAQLCQRANGPMLFFTNNTERVRIDSSGNVGIGTSSPSFKLHVSGSATQTLLVTSTAGDVRLGLDNSGAFYSWIDSYRASGAMAFATSNTERMRIDSSGNLLVGTTSSVANTRVSIDRINGAGNEVALGFSSSGTAKWKIGNNALDSFVVYTPSNTGVYINSGATSWTSTSDERAKDIIEPILNAAYKVSTLRCVIGKYKTDEDDKRRAFLIAQDVQAVLPEAVSAGDGTGMLGLQYTDLIPLLTAAIQEQQAIITALTARVTALEN